MKKVQAGCAHKLDIHCHILPTSLPDLNKKFGYGDWIHVQYCGAGENAKMYKGKEFFREVEPNCWDPETRIKECQASGVTVQCISPIPVYFSYWAKPEDTEYVCKVINDEIADICKKYPKNFVGLGMVPMHAPELAIKELRRCVKDLGLKGIEIGTHVNKWNLDDPNLFPIFQEAEKLGAVIFVHPWDMMGWHDMEKYWLPWLVGMPAESSRAICSLIFGGVFERLPKLKFVFAHGGGSFPATVGRIEHGFNVRPDLCAIENNNHPKKYLGKFWLDSLVHDDAMLNNMINLVGSDRIMLGTDYPFPLGELQPGKLIEDSKKISAGIKKRMLWSNAMEFLGLDENDFIEK